ncbi:DUF1366 domain-containing protein [Streptococcus pasteurianus]|uniref:DUF1366 domain-containing protein n=1 Tax=Streptococcus pasteurianus TaxID=197614 RepID=UPI0025523E8C|nr:DUF1366 domain-containing protein [Streptococcus pasteurianus]MDK8393894.1 DUF1366 domain-containing protein [Streptococcus pasteurianus]
MKLSFNSKSQEIGLDGTISGTRVVLSNNEGGFLPIMLPADKISLSNSELEELALAVVYQENFRDKYENEKFNEITKELAKHKENSEIAQATLLDVVSQLCEKGILTEEFSA